MKSLEGVWQPPCDPHTGHHHTVLTHWGGNSRDNTVTVTPLNAGILQESLSSILHQINTPFLLSPLGHVEKVWKEHSELAFSNLHALWSPVCCQSLRSSSHLTFCLMLACVWGAAATLIVHYFRERKREGGRETGREGEREGKRVSVY